ncbi:MAG: o-succinylbenzoate--CoA ligase [Dehalococcoidia bacterium]|nr:o-succinylbenzoate--CoA ligase [Dehalococcoidia bacterium]
MSSPALPPFDWVAHRACVLPRHPAVEFGAEVWSFAELDRRVSVFAQALLDAGVRPGDRVGLLAGNSAQYVAAVFGAARAGAVVAPLNWRLAPGELAWQLGRIGARLLLHDRAFAAAGAEAANAAGVSAMDLAAAGDGAGGSRGDWPGTWSGDFVLMFTSGTTGRPRAARLTFENFFASAAASAFNIGVDPADRWLACMPLCHVGGLSIATRSLIQGTTAVIHAGFDAGAVNRALREEHITLLSVVPTMLARMLEADERPYPPTVRAVLVGGGPVSRELLERAAARGLPVLQTYGLTEATSQVTTLAPGDALAHLGSAGKPLFGVRLRIAAPAGQPGDILVAGPTVFAGYFDDPEATVRILRDGWLHTGDIGTIDSDGFLTVLDRRDDLVVTGGENVYPAEVEAALETHPAVREAAVVGLPDAHWGQLVAAAVVFREAGAPGWSDLEAWLRERLAGYKVPRRWLALDELPRTTSGKLQRHLVRARFGGEP